MKKLPIGAIGTALVLAAHPVAPQAPSKIDAVEIEKREPRGLRAREPATVFIITGDRRLKVSGFRTKVTIAGKEADRDHLKAGMECEVEAKGDEAVRIDCK